MTTGQVSLLLVAGLVGFFVGAVNPAAITARVLRIDLTRAGSGNPGATNAGRVLGVRYGVLVGAVDVVKGLLPTILALHALGRVTAYVVGFSCVVGHVLSPFLRGRGGKGVATSLGATLAVLPWFALVVLVVFGLTVWATRWVAKASVAAAGALALLSALAPVPYPAAAARIWGLTLAALVIGRHRLNMRGWVSGRGL